MEIENEKRKKKPRKVIKRKSFRKEKAQNVEEVTSLVNGLTVDHGNDSNDNPDIYIEESRSQPGKMCELIKKWNLEILVYIKF